MSFIYKGLKANYEKLTVTPKEVDEQILRLIKQTPKITPVTGRPAQLGDEVVLDYAGFIDGVQFEGGTAQNQTLTLGSGMFIPGFEEQLVGKAPEEEVTVRVRFPQEYSSTELAGKPAEFRCVIHEIRVKSDYARDDELARAVSPCQSYEELRAGVEQSLQNYYNERSEMELCDRLIRKAAATLDFQPTEKELDDAAEEGMNALTAQLAQKNLTLEAYCQFTGTTMEQLRADLRPEGEQNLRIRRALAEIARLEGVEADEESLAEEYVQVCRMNGMTMEQLAPYNTEEFKAAIADSVRLKKSLRLVREAAEVTEIAVGSAG
jgi:trigger factor